MNKETGGPAFPQVSTNPDGDLYQPGMTLRDHFAGLAMQGLLAHPHHTRHSDEHSFAEVAYNIADAMLKARKQ